MTIICSIRALIYCADHNPSARVLPCHIDEGWQGCWLDLQKLLEANQIPIYLASADEVRQQEFPASPKFEIAGSAHTREELIWRRCRADSWTVTAGIADTPNQGRLAAWDGATALKTLEWPGPRRGRL